MVRFAGIVIPEEVFEIEIWNEGNKVILRTEASETGKQDVAVVVFPHFPETCGEMLIRLCPAIKQQRID